MTGSNETRSDVLKPANSTLEDVEQLIAARAVGLSFPPSIELRYQLERTAERRRHLVIFSIIGLLFFDVCVLFDFLLIPDIEWIGAFVRFGVVTPIGLVATMAVASCKTVAGREIAGGVVGFTALAAILGLTMLSSDRLAAYYHFGALIIVMFANVVQRLDFRYAVAVSAVNLALYTVALPQIGHLPTQAALAAILFMVCCVALTLFANHRMEAQLRLAFLYRLRDGVRNEQLDVLTRMDPLTGLANRRQFDLEMDRLLHEGAVGAQSAAVLMIDVDHFKSYNDNYGHPAGDLCLKGLAAILCKELGSFDAMAFRLGGEEIGIVAIGANLADGVRLGEHIRSKIELAAIPHEGNRPVGWVTVSVGVSACLPSDSISKEQLMVGADSALYAAKHAGRNQVWPPPADISSLVINARASAAFTGEAGARFLRQA